MNPQRNAANRRCDPSRQEHRQGDRLRGDRGGARLGRQEALRRRGRHRRHDRPRERRDLAARTTASRSTRRKSVGRIGAQTAKQVMIQKIREAERDALLRRIQRADRHRWSPASCTRYEGGAATVVARQRRSDPAPQRADSRRNAPSPTSACGPPCSRSARRGSRVKVILSRTRPQLVQRLFEQEIPEIADGVIKIRAMAREPGYRSKVAVSSSDQRVDCVGACVGVRGNRIKNIVDELAGERIDIVRWNDDLEVLIPNALQPAEVEQVHPLPDARPGDRAGARGSAVAGHRPPRAERPAGQQAVRLGHRDHDPRGAGRVRSTGRSTASAQLEGMTRSWPSGWSRKAS